MRLDEGKRLFIRSLVNVASEVIPYFWPMRNFIHHNPLYGLEHMPFREAVEKGEKLFHARGFLSRETYQSLFRKGEIGEEHLRSSLREFLKDRSLEGVELEELLFKLMTEGSDLKPYGNLYLSCRPEEVRRLSGRIPWDEDTLSEAERLADRLGRELTLYDGLDHLFGTEIGRTLDELVIKVCADFLDEGQAVWGMPLRNRGLYSSWRQIALRNRRFTLKGCRGIEEIVKECEDPESAVYLTLELLDIPEELWEDYITLELSKLHGWAGFIRWRSSAKDYYWQIKHPADLVDYLAIRLILGTALLRRERGRLLSEINYNSLREFILKNPEEAVMRYEFYTGRAPSHLYDRLADLIEEGRLEELREEYFTQKRKLYTLNTASYLLRLWELTGFEKKSLFSMDRERLSSLIELLKEFEKEEGYLWLRAHERSLIDEIAGKLKPVKVERRRPFAQALFCIDVRSERFRRHLEEIGEYETYGIAGFFGVPVSFIELGKGHETHLCPVLIKPKNVVLELRRELKREKESLREVLEEILHDLKYNILTPYITVEAIGLLFGFDMVGKTLFPLGYSRFREKLSEEKPPTKLMVDKPSREYALEVIGLLQRELIRRALRDRFGMGNLDEDTLEIIRKLALEEETSAKVEELRISEELLQVLRQEYRIEKGYMRIQMEKLAKIGFTLEEQVFFVERALKSIGLTDNFGKLVLVIGHGSRSENNPYESALDCGACGGDHGYINARVFTQMANNPKVRERLRNRGIDIPEDTVFIACEHNTTTDEVYIYDTQDVPTSHLPFLEKAVRDLELAGKRSAKERCAELEDSDCYEEERAFNLVKRNSVDWTQVRPEWGLSGNYAFIIGRRELTRGLNLQGKVFLHSYDWRIDRRGFLLEIILSGPLVVGEWINMEHYFSTVDNESYGSGSKVYHNVVGRFGVMSGNLSDLRTGLPTQTVLKGELPHHRPVRLITLVEAPLDIVEGAFQRIRKVRELVHNRWINLLVLDPERKDLLLFDRGEWVKLVSEVSV